MQIRDRIVVTTSDADALRLLESKGFARYGLEAGGLRVDLGAR